MAVLVNVFWHIFPPLVIREVIVVFVAARNVCMAIARLVSEHGLCGILNTPVVGAILVIILRVSGMRNGKRGAVMLHPVIQCKVVDRAKKTHHGIANGNTNNQVQDTMIHIDGSINLYLEASGRVADDHSLTASGDKNSICIISSGKIAVHSNNIELKFASTLQTNK